MNSTNLPINIITHFYNEEYLLPFWIDWYKRLPINSVTLIDYDSTDKSYDIVKEQAPDHWNLIKSRNSDFCAIACDQEVMEIEEKIDGWKMTLNTTEFLMLPLGVNEYLNQLANNESLPNHWNKDFLFCQSVGIVGGENQNPKNMKDFFSGFSKGYITYPPVSHIPKPAQINTIARSDRILHKASHGHYESGRHNSRLVEKGSEIASNNIFVAWAGYYPWNEKTINRKLQIKNRIPAHNIKHGMGSQHTWLDSTMNTVRKQMERCGDLTDPSSRTFRQDYKNTYEDCLTLL